MSHENEKLNQEEEARGSLAGIEAESASPTDPVMELPEIPAGSEAAPEPPHHSAPSAEEPPMARPRSRSGWKLFAAGLALVAMGAGVGSATTFMLAQQYQSSLPPIGTLWESPSAKAVAQTPHEGFNSLIPDIYRRVAPAVVTILVSGQRTTQGNGSGFVVDPRGYILTNYHVIDGATRIQVRFVDGTTLPGEVVGTDRYKDLAVVKVDPGNRSLVWTTLGDSDEVQVGELAIAIGSPFRQESTVTAGIISGLNRDLRGENNPFVIHGVIQTDAAINPGNSGGPLLNARGEVIGINTAIEGPVRGNVGIGFAVPVNAAKEILPRLMVGEEIQYAYLGVGVGDLTAALADSLGLAVKQGALISDVFPDTPAAAAGLRAPGFTRSGNLASADVVVEIDGKPIRTADDLVRTIGSRRVGDTVTLVVLRGKERLTLTATLAARPAQSQNE